MFTPKLRNARRFLVVAFFLNLPVQNAISAPVGVVSVALEWGSSARTSYTYVFSGIVTCQNHPCASAHIDLDIETTSQGVISKSTQVGADGRYQMEISIPGAPEDSSSWKLQAHSSGTMNHESGEAEGRIILMDGQTTVVVDRSILLIQA